MKLFWLFGALVALLAAWRLGPVLGRVGRVLALLVGVLLALIGFDVFQLPSIEELVSEIGGRLGDWTYVLVGVNAFLETGAFLGFLAPGETMVLFGGVLVGEGTIELLPLIIVVWASAMLGDVSSFAIGHRYGRGFLLRYGERVKIGEPQVRFVERFFARHGLMTVFFGRWVGVVRPLVPFLAGSSRISFWKFLAVDVLATGLWAVVLCILGAAFWRNFDELTGIVGQAFFALGTIIIVISLSIAAVSLRRSRRRSGQIDAWIEQKADDNPLIARCAGSAWRVIGRLEPAFPGPSAARREAARAATVADPAPADSQTDES